MSRATSTALDRLAYEPSFDSLLAECRNGSALFEGRQSTFASSTVKWNLALEERQAGEDALFEGLEDKAGPSDRKYDPAAGPIVKRAAVDVVMSTGRTTPVTKRLGRSDVLAEGVEGSRPRPGNRVLGAVRPVVVATSTNDPAPAEVEDREP